jgi:proteic killer suppression protein
MLRSFKCSETERIFRGGVSRQFPPEIQERAAQKLLLLHAVSGLEDLRRFSGLRLEALKGDRAGQWSIRINDQWRICFRWDGDAYDVEIVDYH